MKTNKILKVIVSIMLVLTIVAIATSTFAIKFEPNGWDGVTNNNKIGDQGVKEWTASIMNIVAIVGSGIAIIALIILGIKYMMGSVEEKAEYKKTLMPYVIGAAFVFGASAIVGFIANVIQ